MQQGMRWYIAILVLIFGSQIYSQSVLGDTLYRDKFKLKNGLIFSGNLISLDELSVVIALKNGENVKFKHSDFAWIRQFAAKGNDLIDVSPKEFLLNKGRKYIYELGIGVLSGGGRNNGFAGGGSPLYAAVNRRIGSGFIGTQWLGVSGGFEVASGYVDYTTIPLTLGLTQMFVLDRVAPWISGRMGYGFAAVDDSEWSGFSGEVRVDGGLRYELAMGFAFRLGNGSAINIQGGFQRQSYSYFESNEWWGTNDVAETLNRVFLRVGIQF